MGNQRYFLQMFKFAAVLALVSASPLAEMEKAHQLFQMTVHEKEVHALEQKARALQEETDRYTVDESIKNKVKSDLKDFAETKEFHELAKFIHWAKHDMKPEDVDPKTKKLVEQYIRETQKLQMSYQKVGQTAKAEMTGEKGSQKLTVDINDDDFTNFDHQYTKVRAIEEALIHTPIVAEFRKRVAACRATHEFEALEFDWKAQTHSDSHKAYLHHTEEFVKGVFDTVHIDNGDDVFWKSHVMGDVFYALISYHELLKGDATRALDFIFNNEYHEV